VKTESEEDMLVLQVNIPPCILNILKELF
jgi:hypothetical protein